MKMPERIAFLLIILLFTNCNNSQKTYYSTGQLEAEYFPKSGLTFEYAVDGTLKSKGTYINGLQEGDFILYHPNGKTRGLFNCKQGKIVGEFKSYYENGNLEVISFFNNDGKRSGTFQKFYPNNSKKIDGLAENDSIIYQKEYDEKGNITSIKRKLKVIFMDSVEIGKKLIVNIIIPGTELNKHACSLKTYYVFKANDKEPYRLSLPISLDLIDNKSEFISDTITPEIVGLHFIAAEYIAGKNFIYPLTKYFQNTSEQPEF